MGTPKGFLSDAREAGPRRTPKGLPGDAMTVVTEERPLRTLRVAGGHGETRRACRKWGGRAEAEGGCRQRGRRTPGQVGRESGSQRAGVGGGPRFRGAG
jgi:hypothetical protein